MPTADELSIPEKLADIQTTKTAIREAIVAKGVDVPEGTTFREYAGKIGEISGGGGAANVTFICEIGANSEYNPTIGIFIITPEGQPQQVNLDVKETKIVQVAANSFMFPALLSDWGDASQISGDAYMVENTQFYTRDYYLSRLVYVYGDCTINV